MTASRVASRLRALIILLAVVSLSTSLATRVFQYTPPGAKVSIRSSSVEAVRQHLDRDATTWARPPVSFSLLEPSTFYPRFAPAGPPLPAVLFDESLSNRPPPSC
jgi:hypothetical protein